jgi:choline transport protein
MVLVAYAAAQQFEALIVLANPSFVIKGWHGALLTIAVSLFAILFNTLLVRKLPLMEGIVIILHVFGFFAVTIVLWVLAPRSNAKVVLTHFEDNAGWGNVGLACLIGILGPVITLIGSDSSCHLSEELKDAAWILPRAMVATAVCNYILGFVMTVTFMFTIGNVDEALATPTLQPYVAVLQNATRSRGATITLTVVVAIMMVFCAVNQVTTSSRQLFAFARDGGLPFSKFLSHVRAQKYGLQSRKLI